MYVYLCACGHDISSVLSCSNSNQTHKQSEQPSAIMKENFEKKKLSYTTRSKESTKQLPSKKPIANMKEKIEKKQLSYTTRSKESIKQPPSKKPVANMKEKFEREKAFLHN